MRNQQKGANVMIVMLWVQKLILGNKTWGDVPRLLKEQVRKILIENGMEELAEE